MFLKNRFLNINAHSADLKIHSFDRSKCLISTFKRISPSSVNNINAIEE